MTTKPALQIDPTSPIPLHEQVAAAIRRAIADGEAQPGQRLPPAKDLAAILHVNTNTVLRALRTLRDEGLVELRQGRGATVTDDAPGRNDLVRKIKGLIALARHQGYQPDELAELIEELLAKTGG